MGRQRWAQCSRADVLWGLAAFACLQIGLAVAIELWLPELRDPWYAYRAARLCRRTAVPERPRTVVMLGSSRVLDGFKAGTLERRAAQQLGRPVVVYNFGVPGAGPLTNLLNLKRLRAEGIRPDLLFVEVVPSFLAARSAQANGLEYLNTGRLWLSELTALGRYDVPVAELYREWWRSWPVPCYSHRFTILSRLAPKLLPMSCRLDWARRVDDCGWSEPIVTTATPESRLRGLANSWQEFGVLLQHFELGAAPCRALRDLLDLCRAEGIPTVLVWMPEGTEFRSWYPPATLAQVRGHLTQLSREYAVPVIDARDWVADGDFSDGQHMLLHGAVVFTERFGREVLLPLLVGGSSDPVQQGRCLASPARKTATP